MKKNRIVSLVLSLLLLVGLLPAESLAAAKPPLLDVKAALLLDGESGETLYAYHDEEKEYPASLTKIMTALLVLEAIDRGELALTTPVTATPSAFIGLDESGSTSELEAGETLTVEQLLACMLINSANEAASILAVAVGGTVFDFVQKMNERAAELGCENTHFVNPTGLHDPEHYTTARDLYRITVAAMEFPAFTELCDSKSYEIPATEQHGKRTLHSTNLLISNWRALGYLYSGAHGIKTGNTSAAGHCLISTATRDSRSLFGVVLGASPVVREEKGKAVQRVGSFVSMAELFDWGFDNFTPHTLVGVDEAVAEASVELSRETNYVTVHPAEDVTRLIPNDLSPEELTRDVSFSEEVFLAPIGAGDEMGTLTIRYGDTVYAEVPLLAMNDVAASPVLTLHYKIVRFFSLTAVRLICLLLFLLLVFLFVQKQGSRRQRHHGTPVQSKKGYRGRRRG